MECRRIRPDDGDRLRTLRLAALAEAPGSFWQTWAEEAARPASDWHTRARRNAVGDTHATFLVGPDDAPAGMVDVHRPARAPEFRELAAMWVAPTLRATGAASALVDAALTWSRSCGAIGVRLWVVPTLRAAVGLYRRHGFVQVGDPEGGSSGKVYIPMVLALDPSAAAAPEFLDRALAPWTDESG